MAASNPIAIPDGVPEDEVDALYGLPLDEFTPRRDDLVKELRSAGKRDEAAWVKALRKPSNAAWLVNQLARTQRSDAARVLETGDALRTAQERALARKADRDELAGASADHAEAMRALLAKGPGLLDRQGGSPSETTLERAAETLRAIPLDDEARAGFASGRLTRERRAAGLGFAASGGPAYTAPAKPAKAPKAPTKESRQAADRKEQKARSQAALKEARSRQRARQREVSEAERDVKQAQREVERAQRRLEKAETEVERAREREAEAAAQVEQAEAAARRS